MKKKGMTSVTLELSRLSEKEVSRRKRFPSSVRRESQNESLPRALDAATSISSMPP